MLLQISYSFDLTDKGVHKIFQDMVSLQVVDSQLVPKKRSVLSAECVVDQRLLEVLLDFLKKVIKKQFIDRENNIDIQQIHRMSGVIQCLCSIIDSHIQPDGTSLFSVKCLQNVGEIFWHMIIN